VQAVGDLASELHRLGTPHRADLQRQVLLDGTGRRGDALVTVEIAREVDRALVEDGAHHLMRLPQPTDRARSAPLDAVLLEHRDVADPEHDLRAAAAELVQRGSQLGDVGGLAPRPAAPSRAAREASGS
jgi:hypothetical protein